MIAVSVQSANGALFLRSLQLPVDTTVIGAALCLDAKSAVRPQLPLGAETMRSLQDAQQHGGADRTDRRNLAEPFPGLVFLALREQIPPHLLPHRAQRIELLVVKLRPPAHSRFRDLPEPFGTMPRCIDLLAGTRNGPTAIDRFHPRHDPYEIFGDGEITTHQFLQTSQAVFTVIDGAKMIETQQLGQPARVDLVTLVAFPHGGILSRIAPH